MKNLYCAILLMVVGISYGQVKFEGEVTDSLKAPFELANVIAINQETKGLESYGITDPQGKFKLELGKNGTYEIQVSYVGMLTFKETLSTNESDIVKEYIL